MALMSATRIIRLPRHRRKRKIMKSVCQGNSCPSPHTPRPSAREDTRPPVPEAYAGERDSVEPHCDRPVHGSRAKMIPGCIPNTFSRYCFRRTFLYDQDNAFAADKTQPHSRGDLMIIAKELFVLGKSLLDWQLGFCILSSISVAGPAGRDTIRVTGRT